MTGPLECRLHTKLRGEPSRGEVQINEKEIGSLLLYDRATWLSGDLAFAKIAASAMQWLYIVLVRFVVFFSNTIFNLTRLPTRASDFYAPLLQLRFLGSFFFLYNIYIPALQQFQSFTPTLKSITIQRREKAKVTVDGSSKTLLLFSLRLQRTVYGGMIATSDCFTLFFALEPADINGFSWIR